MPYHLIVMYLAVMHVLTENKRTVNYNRVSKKYLVFHDYGLMKRTGYISFSDNKLYRENLMFIGPCIILIVE